MGATSRGRAGGATRGVNVGRVRGGGTHVGVEEEREGRCVRLSTGRAASILAISSVIHPTIASMSARRLVRSDTETPKEAAAVYRCTSACACSGVRGDAEGECTGEARG